MHFFLMEFVYVEFYELFCLTRKKKNQKFEKTHNFQGPPREL